jgi:hypothetical protein
MVEAEERLDDEIAQILAQMDELNEAEDAEHGDGDGGGGLPQELSDRERRREKIRAVRAQLEREKGEKLEARSQKSFADPDANLMKTGEGSFQYCYNAQAATGEDGIVVATGLTTSQSDQAELVPMVERVKESTGRLPRWLWPTRILARGTGAPRAPARADRGGARGKRPSKWQGRSEPADAPTTVAVGAYQYAHRKTQGERPFAEIKQTMGFRRFVLRGVAKVRGEWNLVCAAANVLTLHRVGAETA